MDAPAHSELERYSYPIGRFQAEPEMTTERRAELIGRIAALPDELRLAVSGLDDAQLALPYRPEGWSLRQVVHHVADSHMNAYVRLRLALTEEEPAIMPYSERRWAELPDAAEAPVELSLALLEGLHARWAALLATLDEAQWARRFWHPQYEKHVRMDELLALYAWHGRHHTAQITSLRERIGG